MMHINWAFFSTQWQTHWESPLLLPVKYGTTRHNVYVFVFVFSALTIPWSRLEIWVLLELSSYPDCVWCDFCTWGNSRPKCLPFVSNIISQNRDYSLEIPPRHPDNFISFYLDYSGRFLYATYFNSKKWYLPVVPFWWNFLRVLRNDAVADKWL